MQQVLCDLNATRRLLDTCRPKAVVAFHPYWWRIAPVIQTAQARRIPVLYMQHGVYFGESDCVRPLPYDEHFVFGDDAAESLGSRAAGGPVTVTGHSLYDAVINHTREPSEAARALRGDARRLVVVATQTDELLVYDPKSPEWWVRGVAEACRDLDARCFIKLHPADVEVSMYEALEQAMPETVRVVRHGECDLADLLTLTDVLVTRDSTVVFEANLLDVPAITVNLTGMNDRVPFAAEGGARAVYSYADLLPALEQTLAADATELRAVRDRFVARHLGPQDGKATERIADAIAAHALGK